MRILVTGPIGRAKEYAEAARNAHWETDVRELLATRPRELDDRELPTDVDLLVVTSKHALEALAELPEALADRPVAVVGEQTAELVRAAGHEVHGRPAESAAALAATLRREGRRGTSFLWLRGSISEDLALRLRRDGHEVFDVVAYETHETGDSPLALTGVDAAFLASPSAVAAFARRTGGSFPPLALAIGPTTEDALNSATPDEVEVAVLPRPTAKALAWELERRGSGRG